MPPPITTINAKVAALTPELRASFEQIFFTSLAHGYAEPPPTMQPWVETQFGDLAAVRQQTIVKIVNRLTLEGATFSPLRARRPAHSQGGDAELAARMSTALAGPDWFRTPLEGTTSDQFGRIQGRYCISASNIAKIDGWHGLVIFAEPHPLQFGLEHLRDYLQVAAGWFAAAHAQDQTAIYPLLGWNCLPKSGATLMHGHMHLMLGAGMHYARVELWRRAAQQYQETTGRYYTNDLASLHQALGLGLPAAPGTQAFVHLTPLRNREVVVFGQPEPVDHTAAPALDALAQTLYPILRRLIDQHGMRAFNLAIALPPLRPDGQQWAGVPLIARLADRGDPLASSNDWGVAELYGMGCITADPFVVAEELRVEDRR